MTPPAAHDPTNPAADRSRWGEWLVIAVLACGLLLVGAARLPQQAKVPFLLSTALGAALGFGLGQLADSWKLRPGRRVGGLVALLVALGLTAGAWDTHRRLAEFARQEKVDAIPEVLGIDAEFQKMLERGEVPEGTTNVNADELRSALETQRRRLAEREREREQKQTFLGYLAFRVPREWGRWPVAGAVAFWLAELALAAGLAGRIARVQVGEESSGGSPDSP